MINNNPTNKESTLNIHRSKLLVSNIQNIVQSIAYDNQYQDSPLFYISQQRIMCRHRDLLDCLQYDDIVEINQNFPVHQFNPEVELFIKHRTQILKGVHEFTQLLNPPQYLLNSAVEKLNQFVTAIKMEALSKDFEKISGAYYRQSEQNDRQLQYFIQQLFERHAKLLVLRIDLSYEENLNNPTLSVDELVEQYHQAKRDREHLFNNMRANTLFDALIGYAWRLEFGQRTGFHYHMLWFFNGRDVQQDITIAKGIGEYWNTVITQGRGRYHNCNANKAQYKHSGIGMIDHHDAIKRENLIKAAQYLTLPEDYEHIKIGLPVKWRRFGKSELRLKDNRGRPRQYESDSESNDIEQFGVELR